MLLVVTLLFGSPQDQGPTVGDTVWVTHRVRAPAGVSVRPRPAHPSERIAPLGPPEVTLVEEDVRIRYPLVAWEPGRHELRMPGPILVRDDGWSDTLPDWTAAIAVASVLPEGPRDSLSARPPEPAVLRTSRSLLPLGVVVLLAAAVLLPLHWAWRRRGPVVRAAPAPPAGPTAATLRAWAASGEWRAALEGWQVLLSAHPATRAAAEATGLLEALRVARYRPGVDAAEADLCRRAEACLDVPRPGP